MKITDRLRSIYRTYPELIKKTRKMSTYNRLGSMIGENRQLVTNEPVKFEK